MAYLDDGTGGTYSGTSDDDYSATYDDTYSYYDYTNYSSYDTSSTDSDSDASSDDSDSTTSTEYDTTSTSDYSSDDDEANSLGEIDFTTGDDSDGLDLDSSTEEIGDYDNYSVTEEGEDTSTNDTANDSDLGGEYFSSDEIYQSITTGTPLDIGGEVGDVEATDMLPGVPDYEQLYGDLMEGVDAPDISETVSKYGKRTVAGAVAFILAGVAIVFMR